MAIAPFKVSQESSVNYWYELNEAQKNLAKVLRGYLMNAFHLKYGHKSEDMRDSIHEAADSLIESTSNFAVTYKMIAKESFGLKVKIRVEFIGNDFTGVTVSDIKVEVE